MKVLKNRRGDIYLVYKDGHTYAHAVVMDRNVRLAKLDGDQEVAMTPALLHGQPYPVLRAAQRMLAFGAQMGITERARRELEHVLNVARRVESNRASA